VTAVVVSGATVLEPATSNNPLVLEVSAPDSIALAHLVMSGTRLGYIVWPAKGGTPPRTQPLDEGTARALLGLAPTVNQVQAQLTPTATVAASTPTPAPTIPPAPASPTSTLSRSGGFLYQVQPGDTWESIASLFGLSVSELKHWNETSADQDLDPRTLVFIPRS
jgi:LysM repeat protein